MKAYSNLEDVFGNELYIDVTEDHNDGEKTVFFTAYVKSGDIELDSFNHSEVLGIIAEGRKNTTSGNLIINW